MQKYRPDRGEVRRQYALIWGRVENRALTLLDCFRRSAHEFDDDERVETVHVNRYLEGAWFDDPDEFRVDRLVIDLRHFTGWVGHAGLKLDWPKFEGKSRETFATITSTALPSLKTETDDTTIALAQTMRTTGDHVHDLGVQQRWVLRVSTPQPEPLDVLLSTSSDLQDLVTIAVGETAQFEKVVLQHPDVPLTMAGKQVGDRRSDITYHARWTNRSSPVEPVDSHHMYFTFDDLGGMDGIRRWLTVAAEYPTELARAMATRYRDNMYLEDRIMNICAALDSFDKHRRQTGRKRVAYAERITNSVELAGEPFQSLIVIDPEHWVREVVNTRNDLAHHREKFRDEGTVGDHLLSEQLFWLFALCMFQLAELPDDVYTSIAEHSQYRWLRERADQDP